MRHLVWSAPAQRDVRQIATYYGDVDPDVVPIILGRIEAAPLALLDYPQLGSPIPDSRSRKWLVKRTPFILLYEATAGRIEIVRVRHHADYAPE